MTRRPRIVIALLGLQLVLMTAALVGWIVGTGEPFEPSVVLYPAAFSVFAVVGALILVRLPANTIGRLALLSGLVGSANAAADTWARLSTPVPGQDWAAWVTSIGFPMSLVPPLFLLLLFPTGRVRTPRWRIAGWLIAGGSAVVALGSAFTPEIPGFVMRRNPIGVAAIEGSLLESGGVGWLLLVGGAIGAAFALVARLRSARGVERQQLKWIAYAAALLGVSWVFVAFDLPGVAGQIASSMVFVTLLLIPLAAGIAILRHRLYDIDVVIRRTLVYGALVALLGALYAGLTLGLGAALGGITGGQALPVAMSTLAVAALFGPLRARVQRAVDQRFYRSRYDAQRTVEAFAGRLRDQVELEAVAGSLVDVAGAAVRPTSAGLWIRGRT